MLLIFYSTLPCLLVVGHRQIHVLFFFVFFFTYSTVNVAVNWFQSNTLPKIWFMYCSCYLQFQKCLLHMQLLAIWENVFIQLRLILICSPSHCMLFLLSLIKFRPCFVFFLKEALFFCIVRMLQGVGLWRCRTFEAFRQQIHFGWSYSCGYSGYNCQLSKHGVLILAFFSYLGETPQICKVNCLTNRYHHEMFLVDCTIVQ